MFVKLSSVSFEAGGIQILSDVRVTFPSNRLSAIVGPSGSGKSTLLSIISGDRAPTGGRVTFHPAARDAVAVERVRVGWIPQGSNALPARTAIDNVQIGSLSGGASLDVARTLAQAAIDQVGLSHRAQTLAQRLSGGELQRLALARALVMKCEVLLADEPTSSLDRKNAEHVIKLLSGLEWPCTVIVATHDASMMNVADHSLILR